MSLDFTGYNIPIHTQGALQRYVENGYMPGGFLTSVLSNDLFGAVSRADSENIVALPEIVNFIYNRVPSSCWGSLKMVREYSEKKMSVQA